MLKAYGINHDVYKYRIKQGWGLEKTLTTPVAPHDHSCTDHLGNEYPTITAMARAYGISPSTLQNRLENGIELEEALTTPASPAIPSVSCTDHLGNEYPSKSAMAKAYGIT